MNRTKSAIPFFLTAFAIGVLTFETATAACGDQDSDTESPTCATPSLSRPANQSPTQRSDAPSALHQPRSSVLNRSSQSSAPWTPKIIWESQPQSSDSRIQTIQPYKQKSETPEPYSKAKSSRPNMSPIVQGQPEQTMNNDCVEMNFGDKDPCHPCDVPPACPTPLQSPWQCQESCVPMQTVPHRSVQTPISNCSPGDLQTMPIPELDPRVEVEDLSKTQPTPLEITSSGDEPSWVPRKTHPDHGCRENEQLTVESQEPTEISESGPALESLPPQDGDYIFENASFQLPQMQQQGIAANHTSTSDETGQTEPGHGIVIHPPMIQPYNKDQHTFVIENQSHVDAVDITVEISVPDHTRIIAALPPYSVNTPQKALFKFDELPAGDKTAVHLTVITTETEAISFEASVSSRSDYSFRVHGQRPVGVLKNVSYSRSTEVGQDEVQSIPTDDPYLGPVLVRNPFFESLPKDHEAGLPANRR